MFLNGAATNVSQITDAWNSCFIQANWTMVTGGARHPDNNNVGVNWGITNQIYTTDRAYPALTDLAVIAPILPVYEPPYPDTWTVLQGKGYNFGPTYGCNGQGGCITIKNGLSFPVTWVCHYDTTTKEFFWQMTDGFTNYWFICGIDTITLKNPEATGFWFYSTAPRNNNYTWWPTSGWNAWPSVNDFSNYAASNFNAYPQESDNLPGGLRDTGNPSYYYQGSNSGAVEYGPWADENFVGRYLMWPIRYFREYKPITLSQAATYLIWEAQTIKYYRSWDINIGDSFSVGLDTYCWYPMFRRTDTFSNSNVDCSGYNVGNTPGTFEPKTGNFGVAVKKT
jgi:hypothetical protein